LTSGVIISEGATHHGGIITTAYLISCLSEGGLELNDWAFITTGVLNKLPLVVPPAGTEFEEGCGAVPDRCADIGDAVTHLLTRLIAGPK